MVQNRKYRVVAMRPIITSKVKGGLNLRTQSLIQSFYFSLTIAHKHFTGSVVMRENWRGKSNKKRKISIPIEDDDSGVVCVWSRLTHTGRVGLDQSSWGGSAGWPVVGGTVLSARSLPPLLLGTAEPQTKVCDLLLTWAVQVGWRVTTSNYSPGRHINLTNSRRLHRS
uniref:Uncharacterized protein n=1 Tax=Gasterosteus aculeatus TaxID=69293 RepID=G3PNL0_GASAC